MKRHRILIWTASYPPILGGLQTVTQQLAKGLAERGHQVMVLTNKHDKSQLSYEKDGTVEIFRVQHFQPSFIVQSFFDFLRKIRAQLFFKKSNNRIINLIQRFSPDIINIHFPDPQIAYWPSISTFFKGRLIISLHGHDILRWFEMKEDKMVTFKQREFLWREQKREKEKLISILREAEKIVCVSKWLQAKIQEVVPSLPKSKFDIIYNVIDLTRFSGGKFLSYPNREKRMIFAAGRLDIHKGFDLLINAFHEIANKYPNLHLEIAGAGSEIQNLKKLIQRLKLSERVFFLGRLSSNSIVEKLHECEIAVIPSRRETFGISVLEALASNKVVVATNVGGIPEAAGDWAILCDPNAKALKEAIEKALRQEQTINSTKKLEEHLSKFSLNNFINNYESSLLGKII